MTNSNIATTKKATEMAEDLNKIAISYNTMIATTKSHNTTKIYRIQSKEKHKFKKPKHKRNKLHFNQQKDATQLRKHTKQQHITKKTIHL